MSIDYVAMMQKSESGGGNHAAAKTAPVISYEAVKPKRLTKKKNSAQMKKRTTAEKTSMAKGKSKSKGKTKKQKQVANGKKLGRYSRLVASGVSKSDAKAQVWGSKKAKPKKAKSKKSTTKTTSAAPRKASKKPKGAKKHGKKSGSKRPKGRTQSVRTTTTRGSTTINVRVPTPVAKSAKRKKTKSKAKAKTKSKAKKGGSKKKSGGGSKKGAMENPMTGVELFVGTFTGLLGFGTADVVDRIIATHALTATVNGSTTSYTDTPPTANPAQGTKATYASLFNATAVCAPMNLPRWAAGLAISGVPIIIAHWVTAPVGRSALQFFGFGAGMRIVGKGMIDLLALITKSNATGMRLYGGEQRAMAVINNDGSTSTLPSQATTGLGRPALAAPAGHKTGCGCQACGKHTPALAAAPQRVGAGWPSYPATAPAPAVQAGPPAQVPVAVAADQVGIQGVPGGLAGLAHGFRPRQGMYNWGNKAA
jgi:hypothetical protein